MDNELFVRYGLVGVIVFILMKDIVKPVIQSVLGKLNNKPNWSNSESGYTPFRSEIDEIKTNHKESLSSIILIREDTAAIRAQLKDFGRRIGRIEDKVYEKA